MVKLLKSEISGVQSSRISSFFFCKFYLLQFRIQLGRTPLCWNLNGSLVHPEIDYWGSCVNLRLEWFILLWRFQPLTGFLHCNYYFVNWSQERNQFRVEKHIHLRVTSRKKLSKEYKIQYLVLGPVRYSEKWSEKSLSFTAFLTLRKLRTCSGDRKFNQKLKLRSPSNRPWYYCESRPCIPAFYWISHDINFPPTIFVFFHCFP